MPSLANTQGNENCFGHCVFIIMCTVTYKTYFAKSGYYSQKVIFMNTRPAPEKNVMCTMTYKNFGVRVALKLIWITIYSCIFAYLLEQNLFAVYCAWLRTLWQSYWFQTKHYLRLKLKIYCILSKQTTRFFQSKGELWSLYFSYKERAKRCNSKKN